MSKRKRTSRDTTRENAEVQQEAETTTATRVIPKKESAPSFPVPDEKFDVSVPEGFEWDKYRPLKKSEFQADHLYYMHRAADFTYRIEVLQNKVDEYNRLAEEAERWGSAEQQKKIKRLKKMQKQTDTLQQELLDDGLDVGALLEE